MLHASIEIIITNEAGITSTAKINGIAVSEGLISMKQWMETQRVLVPSPEPAGGLLPGTSSRPRYANEAHMVLSHTTKLLQSLIAESPNAQTKAELEDIVARTAAVTAKRKILLDALAR